MCHTLIFVLNKKKGLFLREGGGVGRPPPRLYIDSDPSACIGLNFRSCLFIEYVYANKSIKLRERGGGLEMWEVKIEGWREDRRELGKGGGKTERRREGQRKGKSERRRDR